VKRLCAGWFIPAILIAGVAHGQEKPVLLKNAYLELGDGRVLKSGSVLFVGGKITRVEDGTPSVSDDTTVVDLAGAHVYPGFIDAYRTRGIEAGDPPTQATAPESRTQALPSMWQGNRKGMRPGMAIDAWKKAREKSSGLEDLKSGVLISNVAFGTGLVRGVTAIVGVGKDGDIYNEGFACDLSPRSSGGLPGGTATGYPSNILGNTALLRQTLYDAKRFALWTKDDGKDDSNAIYRALAPMWTGGRRALWEADSEREVSRALGFAKEFGFTMTIKGGRECAAQADALKAAGVGVILRLDYPDAPSTKPSTTDLDPVPQPVLLERLELWKDRVKTPGKLAAAGLLLAFSSEGDTMGSFLPNVRSAIANGLSRDAALRALTLGAAELLGLDKTHGSIAVGKSADLIIMPGDFATADMEATQVVVNGKLINLKEASK
jgi:hypothetical protein